MEAGQASSQPVAEPSYRGPSEAFAGLRPRCVSRGVDLIRDRLLRHVVFGRQRKAGIQDVPLRGFQCSRALLCRALEFLVRSRFAFPAARSNQERAQQERDEVFGQADAPLTYGEPNPYQSRGV